MEEQGKYQAQMPTDNLSHLSPEEKEAYERNLKLAKFVYLDSFTGDTQFINVEYKYDADDQGGRTVIVLGELGLHARMKGKFTSNVYDSKIGASLPKDHDYDVNVSVRRCDVSSVTLHKVLPTEENGGKQVTWNVVVSFDTGVVTLYGLEKQSAVNFKKVIWNWLNFVTFLPMDQKQR